MDNPPSKAGLLKPRQKISTKIHDINVQGRIMPLYLAEKEGLIEVFHDKLLNVYSFIVKASGEVVSFFLAFPESDWPDWLKDHMVKRQA